MKAKLTIRSVNALKPSTKDQICWDTEIPGFGCKVTPKGRKTYFLYYRTKGGQQRRPSIGNHEAIKTEAAREIAKRWLAAVAQGEDPSLTRHLDRRAPTVADLCAQYMAEHAEARKKPSSIRNDKRLIDSHILPAFGKKKVTSIVRSDIASLHLSLRQTPYEANRMLALASKMFSLAERWTMRPDNSNPAKNIDRFREIRRERYLTSHELARLWDTLESEEAHNSVSISAIAAVKLLLLTGRRLSEILSLRWEWIDLETRVMRLPDTKNGALLVSLGQAAVDCLRELDSRGDHDAFVIGGRKTGNHLVNLQKPWRKIRSIAKIDDVRIHDLRHTYASIGAGIGMSLPLLGRLLGHTQPATTNRYAHLAQDPVRNAADAISNEITRICVSDTIS